MFGIILALGTIAACSKVRYTRAGEPTAAVIVPLVTGAWLTVIVSAKHL